MTFRRTATFGSRDPNESSQPAGDEPVLSQPEYTPLDPGPDPIPAMSIPPLTRSDDYASPYGIQSQSSTGPTAPDKCANVIAAGSTWKGTLSIEDSVRIDGRVSGEVEAKGTIHIAEGAVVEAKIRASFVVISGTFKGEVRSLERLELLPHSKVQGDLITKVLNVHEGAVVDGNIRMAGDKAEAIVSQAGGEADQPSPRHSSVRSLRTSENAG